ncbi:MAG: hypothetical protein RLZZ584_1173 [Pseudomonadota bacterium]|jgi:hypothetical protein
MPAIESGRRPLDPVARVAPAATLHEPPARPLPVRVNKGLEQRREARRMLGIRPIGEMVLYALDRTPTSAAGLDPAAARIAGEGVPVVALRDVSASGLSVYVQHDMPTAHAVTIELRIGTMRLDFAAQVAWSARAESLGDDAKSVPGEYVVGLALTGQQALATMLGI